MTNTPPPAARTGQLLRASDLQLLARTGDAIRIQVLREADLTYCVNVTLAHEGVVYRLSTSRRSVRRWVSLDRLMTMLRSRLGVAQPIVLLIRPTL